MSEPHRPSRRALFSRVLHAHRAPVSYPCIAALPYSGRLPPPLPACLPDKFRNCPHRNPFCPRRAPSTARLAFFLIYQPRGLRLRTSRANAHRSAQDRARRGVCPLVPQQEPASRTLNVTHADTFVYCPHLETAQFVCDCPLITARCASAHVASECPSFAGCVPLQLSHGLIPDCVGARREFGRHAQVRARRGRGTGAQPGR